PSVSQVALRVRPMSAAELAEGARPIAHRVDEQVVVLRDPMADPGDVLRARRSREKSYVFDAVFDSAATQETVYRATTRGLVAGVISGGNATVFAYGPTGCGKTYTMLGTDSEPGICARTLSELFQAIEDASGDTEYEVTMSYLEIYNERIRDLLNPSPRCLQLRDDASGTVRVAGITELSAVSTEEVMQLLARGNRQRTQEPTAANRTSSRSHAVLQVTACQRRRRGGLRCGRLFMIDLAGSERAAQTRNRGQRMKEGAHINRSLLALGNCIKALSDPANAEYVNYRDSKLTRLLKDSLGGNSHTVMIAHISPASTAFEESRSTLTYAHRARSIRAMVGRQHGCPPPPSAAPPQAALALLPPDREGTGGSPLHGSMGARSRGTVQGPALPALHRVREQLRGACCEQAALRHLLLRLETPALHARHLLTRYGGPKPPWGRGPWRAGLGVRPPPAPPGRTQWGWRWGEERRGEPDGPGDGKRDSDTGAERSDVPGPPDMAVTCESTAALVEEPGRLRQ
ncbi:KIF19 protein, partial [Steatornis caripensis]|nr:KIF19 protein [Steatornis caripensis]